MASSDRGGLPSVPWDGLAGPQPASADVSDFPPGEYLWATTTRQTVVYDRATSPPTQLRAIDNDPTGNLVRGVVNDFVYVATANGIRTYEASSAAALMTFRSSPGQGYAQAVLTPDGATLYGLRTGGKVVDVFDADTMGMLITSIALSGRATGLSDPQPGTGEVIVIGSVVDDAAGTTQSAMIRTSDHSISYFDTGSHQVVNGTVWAPDGSHAYLATGNLGPTGGTGTIGRYTPPTALSRFPMNAGVVPSQIAVSVDGTRLYLPAKDGSDRASVQVVDTSTMSTIYTVPLGEDLTWGVPAVSPDGKFYAPLGADGPPGVVLLYDTATGGIGSLSIGTSPVLAVLVADRAAQVDATSGARQTAVVNRGFDVRPVATVRDANRNPMPGQQVLFEVQQGNTLAHFNARGVLFSAMSGDDGTVTAPYVEAGALPGSFTITATVTGVPPAEFPCTITPLVPPGPPIITTLTPSDSTLRVGFSPGTPGTAPTTEYLVKATDVTDSARGGLSASGAVSPITLTGLTNGDTYTIVVTAVSQDGNTPSETSQRINVGIPATISGTPPPGAEGRPYAFSFTVGGAPTPAVTLNPGTPLPSGLSFDPATATISGVPIAPGSTFIFVTATNALGSAQATPTLDITATQADRAGGGPGKQAEQMEAPAD